MSHIEVPMPQMGESIAEGTVSKWLKQIGDTVERDEAILEISTDKVDAEIPAPSAGTLVEVLVQEGETVEVGTIVAKIDPAGGAIVTPAPTTAPASSQAADAPEAVDAGASSAEADAPATSTASVTTPASEDGIGVSNSEERLRTRSTPVVRRIAEEAGVDIAQVPGTGHLGRVTKQDIIAYIESGAAEQAAEPATDATDTPPPTPAPSVHTPAPVPARQAESTGVGAPVSGDLWDRFNNEVDHPAYPVWEGDRVEPMDRVRQLTAEHMILAKRTAAHVHSIIEIDFAQVDKMRRENKARWAERGARVSYTAFVAWACSRLLADYPRINGVISGENIVYRDAINVGIAVDLNPGLIVPVIHNTDHLSLVGVASKMIDLATRARSRQLSPNEIQGATFTITNPGVLGTLAGMPVIPKGTSAILGTGAIEKRVVAIQDSATGDDTMAIRKRAYFTLGYDHRLVDGADSARFLSDLKDILEKFPEDA